MPSSNSVPKYYHKQTGRACPACTTKEVILTTIVHISKVTYWLTCQNCCTDYYKGSVKNACLNVIHSLPPMTPAAQAAKPSTNQPAKKTPTLNGYVKASYPGTRTGRKCAFCGEEIYAYSGGNLFSLKCKNCHKIFCATADFHKYNALLTALPKYNKNKQQELSIDFSLLDTAPAMPKKKAVEANKTRDKCIICSKPTKRVSLLFGVVNYCPCTERLSK